MQKENEKRALCDKTLAEVTTWDAAKLLLFAYGMAFALWLVLPSPRDDSDPPGSTSGVTVRTDHLTGCQYLETSKGAITPRLDTDGKYLCNGATR